MTKTFPRSPTVSAYDVVGALGFGLLVAAGLTGCAGTTASIAANGGVPSIGSAAAAAAASAGTGQATVIINGQDQHFQGPVTCRTASGLKFIFLGPPPTTVSVVPPDGTGQINMTDTDPPTLNLATFNINGTLMFAGVSSGNGQVSANGDSYTVTGDSGAGTHFEIDASCA
jgi:hypothetical protein